jgi:ketosteroid isomerase-like protein
MLKQKIAATVLLAAFSGAAFAGPPEEAMAKSHFKAVAAGDIDTLVDAYSDNATLYWIGGTLDGIYHGTKEIRDVWIKFVANNDGQPRVATVSGIEQSSNPKGATIAVSADYKGKTNVKIRHVLVYRDDKLVNEVWQIDPGLQIAQNQ